MLEARQNKTVYNVYFLSLKAQNDVGLSFTARYRVTNEVKLDTQFPIKWSAMVKTANSTIGSLISSEGSLLCTDTCNGKVNYPHEKKNILRVR